MRKKVHDFQFLTKSIFYSKGQGTPKSDQINKLNCSIIFKIYKFYTKFEQKIECKSFYDKE